MSDKKVYDLEEFKRKNPDVVEQEGALLSNLLANDEEPDLSHDQLAIQLGKKSWDENSRFISAWHRWLFWDGYRWLVDDTLKHLTQIRNDLREIATNIVQQAEIKAKSFSPREAERYVARAKSLAQNLKSKNTIANTETLIRANHSIATTIDTFDNNPFLVGAPTGTIDLEQGRLVEAKREHYISKSIIASPKVKTPKKWLKFLNRIFDGNQEIIDFIQRLCGYCLIGTTREQKLFFFFGKGANGKSVFIDILFHIFGDYARRAPATLFLEQKTEQHPTALAGLMGARLVVGSELPSGQTWNESMVKDLTGGDIITARLMRQDYVDFKPQFTILIAGNHQPRLKNVDESTIRRMVLIPFNVTIPKQERDPELTDKLKNESGEILNWMIQGAVSYQQYGLNIPKTVLDASAEYIEDEDVIGEFLHTETKTGGRTEFSELYQAFSAWSETQGMRFPWTERALRKAIKERGYNLARSNSKYYLNGRSLLEPHNNTTRDGYFKVKYGQK